ncbi:MAG: hypothetical protein V1754_02595 [Pseudomonadota bacterium]
MRRFTVPCLFFVVAVACANCCDQNQKNSVLEEPQGGNVSNKLHLKTQPPVSTLLMPYRVVVNRLGSHQLKGHATLVSRAWEAPTEKVEIDLETRVDAQGQYEVVKNTSEQYGQEVKWTGGWIYPRLRFSKFLKRKPEEGEPLESLERLVDLLPAYGRLLKRFVVLDLVGREKLENRKVVKVNIGLAADVVAPDQFEDPAEKWRRNVVVKEMQGHVYFDEETGVPLAAKLKALWNFVPPKGDTDGTGIPKEMDVDRTGNMELDFWQRVSRIGKVGTIQPPPPEQVLEDPKRIRLEIERQLILGEQPIPKGWKRVMGILQ